MYKQVSQICVPTPCVPDNVQPYAQTVCTLLFICNLIGTITYYIMNVNMQVLIIMCKKQKLQFMCHKDELHSEECTLKSHRIYAIKIRRRAIKLTPGLIYGFIYYIKLQCPFVCVCLSVCLYAPPFFRHDLQMFMQDKNVACRWICAWPSENLASMRGDGKCRVDAHEIHTCLYNMTIT